MRTDEFVATLPKGPLVQHLAKVHEILFHVERCGQVGLDTTDARRAAEHSLREIAVYTSPPDQRYAYGITTPPGLDVQAAMRSAAKNMNAAIRKMSESLRKPTTPEQAERAAQRRYERKIEEERRAGIAHIYRESARVRQALADEIHIHVPHNNDRSK